MTKRAYTPPAVRRVDLVAHEVALQVCKTNTWRTQAGGRGRCTSGRTGPCRNLTSPS